MLRMTKIMNVLTSHDRFKHEYETEKFKQRPQKQQRYKHAEL